MFKAAASASRRRSKRLRLANNHAPPEPQKPGQLQIPSPHPK
jgi:hypothetical protein